ncbi:type IV secretion system DNA-binding domain-containing protein [Sphingomonas sp.]|uniref:type IV secretory system conjugative DNA transfer family protein n=1 Tax=Sphingomonas sp. TaxID=28214 RepID=UPI001B2B39C3|nr:type IV secretion system DNA-binding domain-containing protein [Sphingomonas sp.]MBO9714256.1 type IV secretory system conjugative DNA transfer family protein [Sphingomonas sp.]
MALREHIIIGTANHHGGAETLGIKPADLRMHLIAFGQTGVGKSTLIQQLAVQDYRAARGFAVLDPHGDLAESLRVALDGECTTYFDPADPANPYGYNPLRRVRPDKIPLAASGLMEAFKKLWPDAWGVRMEHVLRNSLYALLERDGSTLPDILRMYADKAFRRGVVAGIGNPVVRAFWKSEFANYPPRYAAEALAPVQNRLGALLSDPALYRVFVAPKVDLRFRSIMDEGGALLVNLSTGRLGSDSSQALGSLLVSTLGLAGLSRLELPPEQRRPFHLYVDEFQAFSTLSFANMMADQRKAGVAITLATQHSFQLDPEVRHAVLGNAGSLIAFRTGVEDAALLAREFAPTFEARDFINLPNRNFYARIMIDGAPSKVFSGELVPL